MRLAGVALRDKGLLTDVGIVVPQPNVNVDPYGPAFIRQAPYEIAELKGSDFVDAAAQPDMTGNSSFRPNSGGIRGGGKMGGGSALDAFEDRFFDPTERPHSGTYDPALRTFFPGV